MGDRKQIVVGNSSNKNSMLDILENLVSKRCKKIRSDDGRWSDPDSYIREHTNTQVSHGLCDTCVEITLNS